MHSKRGNKASTSDNMSLHLGNLDIVSFLRLEGVRELTNFKLMVGLHPETPNKPWQPYGDACNHTYSALPP